MGIRTSKFDMDRTGTRTCTAYILVEKKAISLYMEKENRAGRKTVKREKTKKKVRVFYVSSCQKATEIIQGERVSTQSGHRRCHSECLPVSLFLLPEQEKYSYDDQLQTGISTKNGDTKQVVPYHFSLYFLNFLNPN